MRMPIHHHVIVIGAGQAGLSVGHLLTSGGADVLILDAGERLGDVWRNRWDSLRLFTSTSRSSLPGLPFPRNAEGRPSKDEYAAYMEEYAQHFQLPVRLRTRVNRLERQGDRYLIHAGDVSFEADQVVIATGAHQVPRIPAWASTLDPSIVQIAAIDYKNASQVLDGAVLVVGAGNSGAELALESARAGHRVWLSGRPVAQVPPPLRWGSGILFWFLATRVITTGSRLGRKFRRRGGGSGTPLVRIRWREIDEAGVERVPRVVGVRDGRPQLEDGRALDVRTILWCNGFGMDLSWIHLPIFGPDGAPIHDGGRVVSEPGLYFLGLPFQRSLASAAIVGVGLDAAVIARQILDGSTEDARARRTKMTPVRA